MSHNLDYTFHQNGISINHAQEETILISTTPRVTLKQGPRAHKARSIHLSTNHMHNLATQANPHQYSIGLSDAQPRWSSQMILYVGSSNSTIFPGVPSGFHLYSTAYPLTGRPQPHTAYPRVCTDMPKSTVKRVTSRQLHSGLLTK